MRKLIFVIIISFIFAIEVKGERSFKIKKYSVEIKINKNGVIDVREIIDAYFFSQAHGILRWIPYKYKIIDPEKIYNKFLLSTSIYKIIDIHLFDINVLTHPYRYRDDGYKIQLKIGEPDKYVLGNQRYIITYKASRVFVKNKFKKMDELYWNAIGREWDTDIEKSYIYVHMPQKIENIKYSVYTGPWGSKENWAKVNYNGKILSIILDDRILIPGEGITFSIGLPEGIITENFSELVLEKQGTIYDLLKKFFIPLLVFIVSLFLWFKYGKDIEVTPVVQFTPPEGMNPIEAVSYIKEKPNFELLPLLLYWGSKGYIKIGKNDKGKFYIQKIKKLPDDAKEYEKRIFGNIFKFADSQGRISIDTLNIKKLISQWEINGIVKKSSKTFGDKIKYYLKRTEKLPEKEDELNLYNFLFENGSKDEVYMGKLEECVNEFNIGKELFNSTITQTLHFSTSRSLSVILKIIGGLIGTYSIYLEIRSIFLTGFIKNILVIGFTFIWIILLERATQANKKLIRAGTVVMILGLLIQFTGEKVMVPVTTTYITAYIILIFGILMTKRTKKANKYLQKAIGFEEFIRRVDADKIKRLNVEITDYFSQTFPYAVAFGFTNKWINLFSELLISPPAYLETPETEPFTTTALLGMTSLLQTSISFSTVSSIPVYSASVSTGSSSSSGGGFSGGGFGGGGGSSW